MEVRGGLFLTSSPLHSRMSKRLSFPPHICLVEGGQLSAYSLSKGQVHELMPLPARNASGQTLAAQKLVHSQKRNACLIFFQSSPGQCGTLLEQCMAPCQSTAVHEQSLCRAGFVQPAGMLHERLHASQTGSLRGD